jgi:hypothetical protein
MHAELRVYGNKGVVECALCKARRTQAEAEANAIRLADERHRNLGIAAVLLTYCFFPVGVFFAIRSFREARRTGRRPTMAYVAFVLLVIQVIAISMLFATDFGRAA